MQPASRDILSSARTSVDAEALTGNMSEVRPARASQNIPEATTEGVQTLGTLKWPDSGQAVMEPGINWLAVASVVTGATIGWLPGLGMLPLILGLFGLQRAKQQQGAGYKLAVAGIVLGALSVAVALALMATSFLPDTPV